MNRKNFWSICVVPALLLYHAATHSLGTFNFLRPYDILIKAHHPYNCGWQTAYYWEGGIGDAFAFTPTKERCAPLALWGVEQNAITMLMGSAPSDLASQTLSFLGLSAADEDLARFNALGTVALEFSAAFAAHYYINPSIAFAAYLPFYHLRLKDVSWCQKNTLGPVGEASQRVEQYLTGNFADNLCRLGKLNIGPWDRKGLGDLTLLMEGLRYFPQSDRPMLSGVTVEGRAGFTFPTGLSQNEDRILALPFGYDGSSGIIAGGGLCLAFADYLRVGFDVELVHLFGNIKRRRIKTHADQTELLFLQSVDAFKRFGLLQRFTLYLGVAGLPTGFALTAGYQFFKQNENTLAFSSPFFSTSVANSAPNLGEVVLHQMIATASYTFVSAQDYDMYLSLFSRLPFKGANTVAVKTVGALLSINF